MDEENANNVNAANNANGTNNANANNAMTAESSAPETKRSSKDKKKQENNQAADGNANGNNGKSSVNGKLLFDGTGKPEASNISNTVPNRIVPDPSVNPSVRKRLADCFTRQQQIIDSLMETEDLFQDFRAELKQSTLCNTKELRGL
jgi:hypothetical protein